MFKFNFDVEDAEAFNDLALDNLEFGQGSQSSLQSESEPFTEHTLNRLLDSLPDKISYSPLCVPLSSARKSITLIRRDVFDARFQLISSPDLSETDKRALESLDKPSDLIPGVYEGGLKTWECSLDLVAYLDSLKDQSNYSGFIGRNILELGCGTGIPSLYVLQELLSSPTSNASERTQLHLQDYNAYTLYLVTIPNIVLMWYTSPHSSVYRASTNDSDLAPSIDPTTPGELPITPELKQAFISSLESLHITLRLFSGSWDTFHPQIALASNLSKFDTLLTSETIYNLGSLPSLIRLMQVACTGSESRISNTELTHLIAKDGLQDKIGQNGYLCLVAAKVLYFGVGGGIDDFSEAVSRVGGKMEVVSELKTGVGRKVVRVRW